MLTGEKRSLNPCYFSFILSEKETCVHLGESSPAALRPQETECSSILIPCSWAQPRQAVALRPDQCDALFSLLKVSIWGSYLPAKYGVLGGSFFQKRQ